MARQQTAVSIWTLRPISAYTDAQLSLLSRVYKALGRNGTLIFTEPPDEQ